MFNIIVTPRITYFYCFVIIFFFMLKKVADISLIIPKSFNCFIFIFQSKKFLISLIAVSSISFFGLKRVFTYLNVVLSILFSLKRFLTSLIVLYSTFFFFFYLFKALNFSSFYVVKKIIIFLKNF